MLNVHIFNYFTFFYLEYINYMKIVREHISEKFTEDSDPIKDLGIGVEKFFEMEFNRIRHLYLHNVKKEFKIDKYNIDNEDFSTYICIIIIDMLDLLSKHKTCSSAFYYSYIKWKKYMRATATQFPSPSYAKYFIQQILEEKYGIKWGNAHKVNEKFTADSDPIKDMHIGLMHQIETYFKEKYKENIDTHRRGVITGLNAAIAQLVNDNKLVEWIEYLLQLPGANMKECEKTWVLEWAAYNNNIKMIELLLHYGADANHFSSLDDHNGGPIGNAIYGGSAEALEYLINHGANIYEDNIKYIELTFDDKKDPKYIKIKRLLKSALNQHGTS
jgi:hypothetical protein